MISRNPKISVKSAHLGSPRPRTVEKSARGAPTSAMTCEKMDAKMMMRTTIDVVRTVSSKARVSAARVRPRASAARMRLIVEPRAAASVGVTTPTYMPPSTIRMRTATGATSLTERSLSRNDSRSERRRGAASGRATA